MSGTRLPLRDAPAGWHTLKCWPPFFEDVIEGRKTFELRKNDRGYRVGDVLDLREWTGTGYSGRRFAVEITYLLEGAQQFGLMDGFVVLGLGDVRLVRKRLFRRIEAVDRG